MLSGVHASVGAFSPDDTTIDLYCRACAVTRLGEPAVARLEVGLGRPAGWDRVYGWELAERQTENGYEYGESCEEPSHQPRCRCTSLQPITDPMKHDSACPMLSRDPEYCPACAEVLCVGCGTDLDPDRAQL